MADHAPLRVAFTHISRRLWAGGYNYQSNLFVALDRYCPGEIAPVLFAGPHDAADEVAALAKIPGVEIVRSPAFDRRKAGLAGAVWARALPAARLSKAARHSERSIRSTPGKARGTRASSMRRAAGSRR